MTPEQFEILIETMNDGVFAIVIAIFVSTIGRAVFND